MPPLGYENGIDQLYPRLLNVFLEKLSRAPLETTDSRDATTVSTTTTTDNSSDATVSTTSTSRELSDTSSYKSLDHDDDFSHNDHLSKHDANCNDPVTLCNHRNCPVTTATKQLNGDAIIWDNILTKEQIVAEEQVEKEEKQDVIRNWNVD